MLLSLSALARGKEVIISRSQLIEIGDEYVRVRDGSEAVRTLDNDRVFVFIGGELPNAFLAQCGVEIETKFGAP